MMEGLYLGIEIEDEGCSIAVMDPQTKKVQNITARNQETQIPCLLCYDLEEDCFFAGLQAQDHEGRENCIILNRIVSLFKSGRELHLNETTYTAEDLMGYFIRSLAEWVKSQIEDAVFTEVAVCTEMLSFAQSERMHAILVKTGFKPGHVHVLNRQECFMHYLMSLNKELWTNAGYLLDYNQSGLMIYRLSIKKNGLQSMAIVQCEHQKDVPALSMLHLNKETEEQTDLYFTDLVNLLVKGQVVNSLLLTGEGFSKLDWARNMIQTAAAQKSRKIYQINAVYCMGAACAAYHLADEKTRFPYNIVCDGHISSEISLYVDQKEGKGQLILIPCGTAYQYARAQLELMLEEENKLTLYIKNAGADESSKTEISLENFMKKDQDRIRIQVNMALVNDHEVLVQVTDLGFGDFFPASGKSVTKKISV